MTQENDGYDTDATPKQTFEKAVIDDNFYVGQLIGVKEYKDAKTGEWIDPKNQGRQIILDFQLFEREKDKATGKFIVGDTVKTTVGNNSTDVRLSQFVYIQYVKTDFTTKKPILVDGKPEYKTALTLTGKPTLAFKALGWTGPEEGVKFNPRSLLGRFCQLVVKQVDSKKEAGKKVSVIDSLTPFEGIIPEGTGIPSPAPQQKEWDEGADEVFQKKKELLDHALANEEVTQKGYDTALAALRAAARQGA